MLKFNNIKWLLKKNFFITLILLIFVLFFSIYVNFTTINYKLSNNNKLIAYGIQTALGQYQIRLDLYAKALENNFNLDSIKSNTFSTIYYLDKNGNVLDKNDKFDNINKFVEINENTLKENEHYISDLITSKDLEHNFYIAKRMGDNFLVGKLELSKLLNNIQKFDSDFIFVDSYGNVLYSSNENYLKELKNINEFKLYWNLSGVYQLGNKKNLQIKDKNFHIRSFVKISAFINPYFYVSLFVFIIIVMFLWSYILDSKLLKNGLIRQLQYCFDIQNDENTEKYQNYNLVNGTDCLDLQKSTIRKILEYNEVKNGYEELEERLSSMFSKSTIPMLMVDAFTTKIFKANKAALDFYDQTELSITKMNLYMLNKNEQKGSEIDPINFANNIQNSIKNQGFFIQTEHYISGNNFKEIKIYPFMMRSKQYCYDILMIIDANSINDSYKNIKNRFESLDKSFIISMNLNLHAGKLKIKDYSKNIDRILGYSTFPYAHFKEILHEKSIKLYVKLLLELKKIKNNETSNYSKIFEHVMYLRQSNGKYAEFKASFDVTRDFTYNNNHKNHLNISAHLALLKHDIDYEEVKDEMVSYENIFSQTTTILGMIDKDFKVINANDGFKKLLKIQNIFKISLDDILLEDCEGIKKSILSNEKSYNKTVYVKDSLNQIYPCKISYINIKNNMGDDLYCLVFRLESEPVGLDDFMNYYMKNDLKSKSFERMYLEYYYEIIGNMIASNKSFDHFDFTKLKNILNNLVCNDCKDQTESIRKLVKAIEEQNNKTILKFYEDAKAFFKGDINE